MAVISKYFPSRHIIVPGHKTRHIIVPGHKIVPGGTKLCPGTKTLARLVLNVTSCENPT